MSSPASSTAVTDHLGARSREVQGFLAEGSRQVGARGVAARGQAEAQVRDTVTTTIVKVHSFGTEVVQYVEPVVGQVQNQLGDIPEKVVQVIEPVAARVRGITGSAANGYELRPSITGCLRRTVRTSALRLAR